jgi:hypothetical protein
MKTSEQINEIAVALVKARSTTGEIIKGKDAQIGNQKYKYAELDTVIDAILPNLTDNGLFLTQDTTLEEGVVILRTTVMHSSGQWIQTGGVPVYVDKDERGSSMQQLGKSLTYARRYDLGQVFFVFPEADSDAARDAEPRQAYQGKGSSMDMATHCTYGKNKGKRWDEMNDNQLSWYAEEKDPCDTEARAVWEKRQEDLHGMQEQANQGYDAQESDTPF